MHLTSKRLAPSPLIFAFAASIALAQTLIPQGNGNAIPVRKTGVSLRSPEVAHYMTLKKPELEAAWSAWSRREKACDTDKSVKKTEGFDCSGVKTHARAIRKAFKKNFKIQK